MLAGCGFEALGIWGRGPDVFSLFVEQPNACLHATIAPHALAGLGQVSVRLLLVEAGWITAD